MSRTEIFLLFYVEMARIFGQSSLTQFNEKNKQPELIKKCCMDEHVHEHECQLTQRASLL